MVQKKILVLGIGNILLKDEGLGIRVINYLGQYHFPPNVELMDGGTATLRLFGIFTEIDHLIVIDAVKGNMPPGTVYHLTPQDLTPSSEKGITPHDMGLIEALEMSWCLERKPLTVDIYGVEPFQITCDIGLSPQIETLIPQVAEKVHNRIIELLSN